MIYTLHQKFELGENARLARNIDGVEAIPEATSFWALVFPPLWLMRHGLWFGLLAYLLFTGALIALLTTQFWPVAIVLGILPGLYLWLEGNQLRRNKLSAVGYEITDIIEAPSEDVALARLVLEHTLPTPPNAETEATGVKPENA